MIYLDNSTTSWPKPEIVYKTMDNFMRTEGGSPSRGSHSMAIEVEKTINETRMLVARLINARDITHIIFTANCTDALNMGLKGLLKPGQHVITDSINHNSLARPLKKLELSGVKITRLPLETATGAISSHALESAIRKETRLIVVTHASNVTGVIQPIEEYGDIARKHGVIFMVDAAQTAGKYPLDVKACQIDLLAFSGHKGLLGPPGTGVLFIGEGFELDTTREGGTGSYSEQAEQPSVLPDRYECGTINSVGIAGLGAGIKFINSEGTPKIRSHGQMLIQRLIDGLSQITGVKVYTAPDIERQAPLLSFTVKGYEPGEVGAILDQAFDIKVRTGLQCAPAAHKSFGTFPKGTIRVSPGYFNTLTEMDSALRAIEQIAHSKN